MWKKYANYQYYQHVTRKNQFFHIYVTNIMVVCVNPWKLCLINQK